MQEFEYVAPTNLEDAIRLMAEKGPRAKALAGGTDIVTAYDLPSPEYRHRE